MIQSVSMIFSCLCPNIVSFFPLEPVDMFSDDVPSTSKGETSAGPPPLSDEVMWEYRLKNEEDEEIHGPFSSTQMKEWTESK